MSDHPTDPSTHEDPHAAEAARLDDLAGRFLAALRAKEGGRIDDAEASLRDILAEEPRLAEPRMELARLLLDTERIPEALAQAREALEHLEASGVWTADVPEHVVRSIAHALMAEVLRRHAESDEVVFGDPETFKALIAESKQHFSQAAELDPSDAMSSYYAFFLGPDDAAEAAVPTTDAPG